MTLILILFAAGLVLLAADVFVSSLVLAAGGAAAMAVGVGLVYARSGPAPALAAGVVALMLLVAAVYSELVLFPRTRWGRGFVVESTSGAPPNRPSDALVGKGARAVTTLAPSGYVLVDGIRYEAFCQAGLAAAGTELQVVGVDAFRLVVAPGRPPG